MLYSNKINRLAYLVLALVLTACPDKSDPVLSKAQLDVAPAEIDFGETDTERSFTIKNTGQQNLTWTITEGLDWVVNFQTTTAKITGVGETQITVKIDRSKLPKAGVNEGNIQVTAKADDGGQLEGGGKDVTVKATKAARLQLSMPVNFITDRTSKTAKARANLDNLGSATVSQHGHVWNTSGNPNIDGSDGRTTLGELARTQSFESPLTDLQANTTYYVRAYATNEVGTSYSAQVDFKTKDPGANNPPSAPSLISPANAATNIALNTNLTWQASTDADGDAIAYDVFLGTTNPPTTKVSTQNSTSYTPSGQANATKYYWKIVAKDGNAETSSDLRNYTTVAASSVTTGTMTYNGKTYKTIKIGSQWWLAENLNYNSPTNGNSYCYNTQNSNCDTYGTLYTWDAAVSIASKIPGWHLPTDEEWKTLEMALGMSQSEADDWGWRGTNEGTKLKKDGSSGMDLRLAGSRDSSGYFYNLGDSGYFWSASPDGSSSAWRRHVYSGNSNVYRSNTSYRSNAFSVRLVKD